MNHLFLLNLVLFVACAFGSDMRIGTNEVNLTFGYETSSQADKAKDRPSVDESLSQADKAVIIEDIRHVLSTATVGKMTLEPYEDTKKQAHGIKGRISIGSGGHLWPRAFWENDFGQYRVDEKTSKKELIVPEKLLEAYREAIEFKKTHPEAFVRLEPFLTQINRGFHPEQMTLAEKKALFWFHPEEPAWTKENYYDKNIKGIKLISFKHPSLLTFQEAQVGSNAVIVCKLIVYSKQDGSLDQMTLVYDGTRWRIAAF